MTAHKTEKLYLNDPFTVAFRANVLACERTPGGGFVVLLDRSCFYPESGGQTADTGTLGGLPVVDVTEDGGGAVLHHVGPDAGATRFRAGEEIEGVVDRARRFDHMQQHTGQHILSRAFFEVAALHTVSFHMGEDTCTIDLEGDGYGADVARRAETLANEMIVANRSVTVRSVPVDRLGDGGDLQLRRAIPDGVSDARLVEIEGFDVIPCCGTHVAATGQLGLVKILKSERARGLRRVYFKVGGRAMRDYAEKHNIVHDLGNRLTTSPEDIVPKVEKLVAEGRRVRKELKRLSEALAGYEARALLDDRRGDGVTVVVRYFADRDDAFVRQVSTALREAPGLVAVLGAGTGGVVCSASGGVDVDFTRAAVEPIRAAGGSGGGKGAFAQLKLPEGANVAEFLEEIAANVRNALE